MSFFPSKNYLIIMFILSVLFLITLPVLIFFYNNYWKRRNLPPGPCPWPILGNAYEIGKDPPGYKAFQTWEEKYGPIFTYWLGEDPIVAITDFKLIKETFIRDSEAYAGRDLYRKLYDYLSDVRGLHGIARTEDEKWRILKRFSVQLLKNLGMGRSQMEEHVLFEVEIISREVWKDIKNGIVEHRIQPRIDRMAASTISELAFGTNYHGDNYDQFDEFKSALVNMQQYLVSPAGMIICSLPFIRKMPYFSGVFKDIDHNVCKLYRFYDKHIKKTQLERKERIANGEDPTHFETNFVNAYLGEMERSKGRDDEKYFDIENLRGTIFDLFFAGQESTSTSIAFLVLYMIHFPECQVKLHAELDKVIGENRIITTADRVNLPYTNAVVNETLRLVNLVPQNLVRRTLRDVNINGYKLPKYTSIVPQISVVLINEKIFPDPNKFMPERFLDENLKPKRYEEFVPFSIGKRQCFGESFARLEIFLFCVNIFNQFKFLPIDPNNLPSLEKIAGIGILPYQFKCRIIPRYEKI